MKDTAQECNNNNTTTTTKEINSVLLNDRPSIHIKYLNLREIRSFAGDH